MIESTPETLRTYLESVFGTPRFRFANGVIELALPTGQEGGKLLRLEPPGEWAVRESVEDDEAHAIGFDRESTFCGVGMGELRTKPSDDSVPVTCASCVALLIAVEIVSPPGGNTLPAFAELTARMDELATELGLKVTAARTGKNYRPAVGEPGLVFTSGVGVYSSSRGVEFNLQVFRELGEDVIADDLFDRVER